MVMMLLVLVVVLLLMVLIRGHQFALIARTVGCSPGRLAVLMAPIAQPIPEGDTRAAARRDGDQIVPDQPGHRLAAGQQKLGRRQPLRDAGAGRERVAHHKIDARVGQLAVEPVHVVVER